MNTISTQSHNPTMFIVNGQIKTTTDQVARHFGKRHADVMRAIDNLECSKDFSLRNFAQSSFEIAQPKGGARKQQNYQMTKDGFAFLAMGFTGKEAAAWKEAYINAFNAMELKLLQKDTNNAIAINIKASHGTKLVTVNFDTENKEFNRWFVVQDGSNIYIKPMENNELALSFEQWASYASKELGYLVIKENQVLAKLQA